MKRNRTTSPWTREAKRLRLTMTPETRRLWSQLRCCRLDGFKFRREHPIGPYFVDFFCHSAKVAVDVDGDVHSRPQNIQHDQRRVEYFASIGVALLRFTNEEVRFHLESVLKGIRASLLP